MTQITRQNFRQIYKKYYKLIFFKLKNNIGLQTEKEDICQEIFMKLWEYRNYFNSEKANFYTFLNIIANSVIKDYIKSNYFNYYKIKDSDTDLIKNLKDVRCYGNVEMELYIFHRRTDLTEKQKKVIYYYLTGFTQEEIGKLTGCSKSAINQNIKTIKKKLLNK